MNNKKSKIITIILLFMTVSVMGAIFYIGYVLTATPEKEPVIAPQKIKAQSSSSSRFITLNTVSPTVTISPTPSVAVATSLTPTPTEIILANQNLTLTVTASPSATVALSKTKELPQTGFITNAIILFGMSAVVIFISFIF